MVLERYNYLYYLGPLQDSAVWIDESQTVYAQLGRGRTTSPLISKDDEDPLGISDEGNRAKSEDEMLKMFPDGKFEHANILISLVYQFGNS